MSTLTELEARFTANPYSLMASEWRLLALDTENPALLAMLAEDDDEVVRENVASNPYASAETLLALSTDEEEGVRNLAAVNPSLPVSALYSMLEDGITWDYFIARNVNCPAGILMTIAKRSASHTAHEAIAHREDITDILAVALVKVGFESTSLALAANPNISPAIRALLGRSSREAVVKAVIDSPHTPREVIQGIAFGKNTVNQTMARYAAQVLRESEEALVAA